MCHLCHIFTHIKPLNIFKLGVDDNLIIFVFISYVFTLIFIVSLFQVTTKVFSSELSVPVSKSQFTASSVNCFRFRNAHLQNKDKNTYNTRGEMREREKQGIL